MHPDARRGALVARIRDAPDDRGAREVLADWLLQGGDPEGELVALQLALAADPPPEARDALEARERAWWARHGAGWRDRLGLDADLVRLDRGLVHAVRVPSAAGRFPLDAVRVVLHDHPVDLVQIEVTSPEPLAPGESDRLLALLGERPPPTVRFQRMLLGGDGAASAELLLDLLAAPWLAGVRELEVSLLGARAAPEIGPALAASAARLERLRLSLSPLDDDAVVRLLRAGPGAALHAFELASGHLRDETPIRPILEALPPTLRHLAVERGRPDDAAAVPAHLESLRWTVGADGASVRSFGAGLTALALSGEGIGFDPPPAALRRLALTGGALQPPRVPALAAAMVGWPLERLDLSRNRDALRTEALLEPMGRALAGRSVHQLDLGGARLPPGGLVGLARRGALASVRALAVEALDPADALALGAHAPQLRSLVVRGRLHLDAVPALAEGGLAQRLHTLGVPSRALTDGAGALAQIAFPRLAHLRLPVAAPPLPDALREAPWFAGLAP